MAMPVPEKVKDVVAFIFAPGPSGSPVPAGTGFFVGIQSEKSPDRSFVYLVTAKHVFQTPTGDWQPEIFIRLNRRDGRSDAGKIPLVTNGEAKNVFVHSDDSVDIVVMPLVPDEKTYETKYLPEQLLTTKEQYKQLEIREGSEVFFTGLFAPFMGSKRNYPIVRFGRVALVTDERIDFGGKKAELYLMETSSYGGNSGAPVFFYLGSDRNPGSLVVGDPVLQLAGVMSGRFNDAVAVQTVITTTMSYTFPNMGIAGVVPAYKLRDILSGDELKKLRAKKEKAK